MGARSLSQPDALTGVIAALPAEARTARRLKSKGWRIVAGGVGAERARAAANQLVAHGAHRLLVWGTAGALQAHLRPGAVILADRVFDGHSLYYPVTASWHRCLRVTLPATMTVHIGPLLTVDRPVADCAGKVNLAQSTAAIAVDMEAAAVARVAAENGIAFAALRVIVDPLEQRLPAVVTRTRATRYMPAAVALRLLTRPGDLSAVLALGRNMRVARRSLVAVAEQLAMSSN